MKGYLFVMLCCVITNCMAEFSDNRENTRHVEPRKGKHDLLFLFGGLHGLAAFVILKIKIVLVLITIIGGALLALKFFSLFKYSNYVYKSNYPIIDSSPAYEYANYPPSHTHDHKWNEDYSLNYDETKRSDSQDFMNQFFIKIEEILPLLMNFDNQNCRDQRICQITAFLGYSNFSECRSLYPSCIEQKTTGEQMRHR